jgi:hypothetical protein
MGCSDDAFHFLSVIAGLDPAIQVDGGATSRNLDHRVSLRSLSLGHAKRGPEGSGPVMTEK